MIYMLKREITKAKFKFISFVSSKYAFAMFSSSKIWRPWIEVPEANNRQGTLQRNMPHGEQSTLGSPQQSSQFKHPVRLLWTKAVFDYMYASGETLLRNFPVQATIQVVDWSSDEEEEGDEDSWEHNEEEESTISCDQESKKSSSQGETKKRNFQEI
ncbi:protein ripply1-like isoform X1 [Acropora muricata]|uniref:protein ripply1-like isoform X1 n=1 Tax=Acropora muricata TaxID=159855 RepID=UPI0034E50FED